MVEKDDSIAEMLVSNLHLNLTKVLKNNTKLIYEGKLRTPQYFLKTEIFQIKSTVKYRKRLRNLFRIQRILARQCNQSVTKRILLDLISRELAPITTNPKKIAWFYWFGPYELSEQAQKQDIHQQMTTIKYVMDYAVDKSTLNPKKRIYL